MTIKRVLLASLVLLLFAGGVVAQFPPDQPHHAVARRAAQATKSANGSLAAPMPMVAADAATGASGAPASSPAVPLAGQKIVRTADLRVRVARHGFARAFDEAAAIAARHGGFVADSSTAASSTASGSLTLRIPSAAFEAARHDLAGLGRVESEAVHGQDVTAELVDYGARILSLQAQEEALRTLLGRAQRVGEVLEVQGQLFNVRQQIEQLQAQRTQLDDSASLSTLRVSLFEPGAAVEQPTPDESPGLARDLHRAWHGAAAVIGGMIIVAGYLTPLVLLAALVWLALRLARLRRGVAAA